MDTPQNTQNLEDLLREYNENMESSSPIPDPERVARESRYIREMYAALQQNSERSGHVRVILKRIRTERSWEYVILALFAEGFNKFQDDDMPKIPPSIVYSKPQTSCTKHASDMLYKNLRDSKQTMVYMPFMNQREYEDKIRRGRNFIEFMDRSTGVTEDPFDFVRAAIHGYFANEKRLIIPKQLL